MDCRQLRVGDLISIPDVQLVIQLAEARDLDPDDLSARAVLESLTHSFVITDDIRIIMSTIFNAVATTQGRGFFIAGGYGSGKSHLLSVISLALKHAWAWQPIVAQLPEFEAVSKSILTQHPLTVLIPLTEFSSSLSLEEITWSSVEIASALEGVPLSLSHSRRFLSLFNRYILPVHIEEFEHFRSVELSAEYSWDRIVRDDPAAAHTIALQFLNSSRIDLPFRSAPDRASILEEIIQSLRKTGLNGLVVIFDELSEFLKSKPDSASLNEDARFLQYLGEASEKTPLWIITALQDALDRTGAIQESVHRKIADRYEKPFRLGSRHLRDLISKRLILKKGTDAHRQIRAVFESLRHAFRQLDMTASDFEAIYPVHPETLDFLAKNPELFSQHRGAVAFITTQIAGRPAHGIPGILDQPVDTLLTPDTIFDQFEDKLRSSPEYSKYYRLYHDHFLEKISEIYPEQTDRNIATKIIKLLILIAATPIMHQKTGRELANILLFRALDDSLSQGQLNYTYFYENYLERLYVRAGHIRKVAGKTLDDTIYSLDVGLDLSEYIQKKKASLTSGILPGSESVMNVIYGAMSHGRFPMAIFHKRNVIRDSVKWENTHRRVLVRLDRIGTISQSLVQEIERSIASLDVDLVLWIGIFSDRTSQILHAQKFLATEKARSSNAWVFCIPNEITDSETTGKILDLYASQLLLNDDEIIHHDESSELQSRLRNQIESLLSEVNSSVLNSYLHGSLLTSKESIELQGLHGIDYFDGWLSSVLKFAFQSRFPLHHRNAPHAEIAGKAMIESILNRLILPGHTGEIEPGRDDAIDAMIRYIAVPVGIATKDGKEYKLAIVSQKSPVISALSELLPPEISFGLDADHETVPVDLVWKILGSPPHGISRSVFDLMLLALFRKGYISLLIQGKPIELPMIRFPLALQSIRIGHGKLLPEHLRRHISVLYKALFNRILNELDMDRQEEAWEKLNRIRSRWLSGIADFKSVFQTILMQCSGDNYDPTRVMNLFECLSESIGRIDSNETAYNGLVAFFSPTPIADDFETLIANLKRILVFGQSGGKEYLQIRNYYFDPRFQKAILLAPAELSVLSQQLRSIIALDDEIVVGDGLNCIRQLFYPIRSIYQSLYSKAHQQFIESKQNENISTLELSSEFRLIVLFSEMLTTFSFPCLSEVRMLISQGNRTLCHRDPSYELEHSPVCACGFVLMSIPDENRIATVMRLLQREIHQVMQSLRANEQLISSSSEITPAVSSQLHAILEIDPRDSHFYSCLLSKIDSVFLTAINTVFRSKQRCFIRKLDDLNVCLQNRIISRHDVQTIINDWIDSNESPADTDIIQFE